jgi:hypothetical protein
VAAKAPSDAAPQQKSALIPVDDDMMMLPVRQLALCQ